MIQYKRAFVLHIIWQFLKAGKQLAGWLVHKFLGKKIFYFCNSSSFYLFELIGLTGVSVPSEIKRFSCVTPISVSRRSITKCLCRALNVPLSNNMWATLQQTLQPQPAQNCPGHQGNEQKPSV